MFREKISNFYLVFDDDNELVGIEPICMGKYGSSDCIDKEATPNTFLCSKKQRQACQCSVFAAALCRKS
jgi:hypothetical protein